MKKQSKPVTEEFMSKFVKEELGKTKNEILGKVDTIITKTREDIMKVIDKKHNEIMNKFDKFISMYQKVDEDQTVSSFQIATHTDKLEDYDGRIKKLETVVLQ